MDTPKGKVCMLCGRPVDKSAPYDFCAECLSKTKERYDQPKTAEKKTRSRKWAGLSTAAILVVCAGVISLRTPQFREAVNSLFPPPPDAGDPTDLCIANLWVISGLLQEGRLPPDEMVCPLTQMPYQIREGKGKIVVSCPHPLEHGFKVLQVGSDNPTPETVPAVP